MSIRPIKKIGGWWRWALLSPDGVAPSQMVDVSASGNLPLHLKGQSFSSRTGSPGKRAVKRLWCGVVVVHLQIVKQFLWEFGLGCHHCVVV